MFIFADAGKENVCAMEALMTVKFIALRQLLQTLRIFLDK
jgi:hypothetical protein